MNKSERLLLEAIKAGMNKLSELSDNPLRAFDPIEGIRFVFEGEEHVLSVKRAGIPSVVSNDETEPVNLDKAIMNILRKVGVPTHLIGYTYLKQALKLVMEDPEYLRCVTKGLYPEIAEMNDSTTHKVERGMRHAVEVTYRHPNDALVYLFGNRVDSPSCRISNMEFVSKLAETLKMECE